MGYYQKKAVSFSRIKEILRSPAHYKWVLDNPSEPTPAMEFGKALHMAVLEPEKYPEKVVMAPAKGRKKEEKAAYEEFVAANPGKIFLNAEQLSAIQEIKTQIAQHKEASTIISRAEKEVECFWEKDGIEYKAKLDVLDNEGASILDIKTCLDASSRAAQRTTLDRLYHLQAAIYREAAKEAKGLEIQQYRLLYVEKEPPYAVALYDLDEAWMDLGETQLAQAREILRWCLGNDQWPSYQPFGSSETLTPPKWAWNT